MINQVKQALAWSVVLIPYARWCAALINTMQFELKFKTVYRVSDSRDYIVSCFKSKLLILALPNRLLPVNLLYN